MGRSVTNDSPDRILPGVRDLLASSGPRRPPRWWIAALLCASVLTAANASKPLVIDDPVYVTFARQIQEHPSDPYGFDLYWYDAPEPAMRFGTLPAVLPYWLAGAMTLFGDSPVAWKLSLLPFALALTGSLAFLLGRFARPFATPVLWTLALGPSVLPGFNLMLDVPALALGLLGFALFVRACELERMSLALGAGLVLGLAMQTKYSAVVYPALAVVYAALYRRPREGAIAVLAAAVLFVGWEALLVARYGQSHFLAGIERLRSFDNLAEVSRANERMPGTSALYWSLSLLSLLGSTAPYAALLALIGLGARRLAVYSAALVAALAFAAIPAFPWSPAFKPNSYFAALVANNPELLLFVPLGVAVAGCVLVAMVRLLRAPNAMDPRPDRLLAAWLLLEIVGFFVISPYPAVRRVIGLGIAATLLAARAASRRQGERDARAGVWVATAFGLALGALYFSSDLADALARRALIERVAQRLSQLGVPAERASIWYSGHWEVQFYGEQAGWRPVIPGESQLRAGDWLVLPAGVIQPRISYPPLFQRVDTLTATSRMPWSTIPNYYSGLVPLRRQPVAQVIARLSRATADINPQPVAPAAPSAAR